MAFSTQRNFFNITFMNEPADFECTKANIKLKNYKSTTDDRAWGIDTTAQSKFLVDLLKCNTTAGDGSAVGTSFGRAAGLGRSGLANMESMEHGTTTDSVLVCANENLAKLEAVLGEKESLEKQLQISNINLKKSKEENENIMNILKENYDAGSNEDFYNKIQKLVASKKIDKNDEIELMSFYEKSQELGKAIEVAKAEVIFLKCLIEKLSLRAKVDSIKQHPETSTDIPYLQGQLDCLRKEVVLLREYENYALIEQQNMQKSYPDAEKIKAIMQERNSLRKKCKSLKTMENKIFELQKKVKEAECQNKYIASIEREIQGQQEYYERVLQSMKDNEERLNGYIKQLKRELCNAKRLAQKSEYLQKEVDCLHYEMTKRKNALSDYDCQYKQLMKVVKELQKGVTQPQIYAEELNDLVFYSRVTLNEILKEITKRSRAMYVQNKVVTSQRHYSRRSLRSSGSGS